jgi:hypothetical protein
VRLAAALEAVRRVLVAATLVVRLRAQVPRRVQLALIVLVLEARLHSVHLRHPAEVVVERAVLHHQHDERVDREVARTRKRLAALAVGRLRDEHVRVERGRHARREARGRGGALEELPPAQVLVRRLVGKLLRELRVADVAHGADATESL